MPFVSLDSSPAGAAYKYPGAIDFILLDNLSELILQSGHVPDLIRLQEIKHFRSVFQVGDGLITGRFAGLFMTGEYILNHIGKGMILGIFRLFFQTAFQFVDPRPKLA